MDSYLSLTTFIVTLQILTVSSSDYIIDVTPECAASYDSSQTSTITVKTDLPSTQPFAVCKDNDKLDFDKQPDSSFTLTVYFEGDPSLVCVWNKMKDVDTFTIDVYVPETANIFTNEDVPRRIVCNYGSSGAGDTDPSAVGESLKPVKEIQNHMATVSDSSVDLCVADVLGNCLTGRIALGKSILLKAVLTGNIPDEPSFQALSCKAVGGSVEYPVLVGGCGDGVVIPRDQGFITSGKVARSPYFRSFRLPGSRSLSFDCTFIVCKSPCDGSSCDTAKRRKRHAIQQIEATLNRTNTDGRPGVVEEVIEETKLNSPAMKSPNLEQHPVNTKPDVNQNSKRKVISLNQTTLWKDTIKNPPIETNVDDKEVSGLHFEIKLELIFLVFFACLVGIGIVIFAVYIKMNSKDFLKPSKFKRINKMCDSIEKESLLDNKA